MRKLLISIICILGLCSSVFAEAAIIYAPSKPVEVKDNNAPIYTPDSIIQSDAYTVIANGLTEDTNQIDYNSICKLHEDDNGNLYVKQHNVYIKNAWRKIDIDDFSDHGDIEGFNHPYIWVFCGPSGKITKATNGKIRKVRIGGNTYAFNEYGQMLEGYFNENGEMWKDNGDDPLDLNGSDTYLYYADINSGKLTAGWHRMMENTDKYDNKEIWLYFNPSNFRSIKSTGDSSKTYKIDGKEYAFDDYGVMLVGFEAAKYNEEHGGSTSVKYYADKGTSIKNSFAMVDLDNETNEEKFSDYTDYDEDIMVYLNKSGQMYKNQIKKINSAYYGFDTNGVVLKNCLSIWNNGTYVDTISTEDTNGKDFIISGKYRNKRGNNGILSSGYTLHYFDNNGKRQLSGNLEFSDENYTYKATNNGATEGLKDKKFYTHGLLMKPIDNKYGIYIMNPTKTNYTASELFNNTSAYVVNKSGQKQTSTTALKDDNDNYWLITSSGNLIGVYNCKIRKSGSSYEFYNENTSKWEVFDGNSHRATIYNDYALNFKVS